MRRPENWENVYRSWLTVTDSLSLCVALSFTSCKTDREELVCLLPFSSSGKRCCLVVRIAVFAGKIVCTLISLAPASHALSSPLLPSLNHSPSCCWCHRRNQWKKIPGRHWQKGIWGVEERCSRFSAAADLWSIWQTTRHPSSYFIIRFTFSSVHLVFEGSEDVTNFCRIFFSFILWDSGDAVINWG